MDNQELLSLLNEKARPKEAVLREQEAEKLRMEKEQREKQEQIIKEIDAYICSRFKDALLEAVKNGHFTKMGYSKIVTGKLVFNTHCDYSINRDYADFVYFITEDSFLIYLLSETDSPAYMKNYFFNGRLSNYRKFRLIKNTWVERKTLLGKFLFGKGEYIINDDENKEQTAAFINVFNSELQGIAKITQYDYRIDKYVRRDTPKDENNCDNKRNIFKFIAEF